MKRKIFCLITVITAVLSSAAVTMAQEEYIPLRSTFEGKDYGVEWSNQESDRIKVNIGDYLIEFRNGSNSIVTDEGTFTLEGNTYIEDGVTYITADAVDLCDNLYLYHSAIIDAVQADEDELFSLHAIDTSQDQVLVCTWHDEPEAYPEGEEITTGSGEVWVFTAEEVYDWGQSNEYTGDMVLRMEQLIGLPPQDGKTHFTLMWVDPDDLFRPSADPDIDTETGAVDFPEGTDEDYIRWYNENAEYSYEPHRYPWTRLGYTYDWSEGGTDYGLSEYILKENSRATVERTFTNEEFFEYITAVDYSDKDNWAYWNSGEDKAADLFIVCPTVHMGEDGRLNADMSDEDYRSSFTGALNMELGIYDDVAAVYAPYYRQATFPVYSMDEEDRENNLDFAYEDVKDAFLYYAEHSDGDRPLILAGFSQGSDMVLRLMEDLFDEEKYQDRLVATYCIGWGFTAEDMARYPQLKPAQGESDTGVIVTFNSEAEDITSSLMVGADEKTYSINPLSWRTDSVPADKSLNKGACFTDYSGAIIEEIPEFTGAYIDEIRGTLKVTDINPEDYTTSLFEDGIYHLYDYQFFYRNLEENVGVRLEEYLRNN